MSDFEEFDMGMTTGGATKGRKRTPKSRVLTVVKKKRAKSRSGRKVLAVRKTVVKKRGVKKSKSGSLSKSLRAATGSKTQSGRITKAKSLLRKISSILLSDYKRSANKTKYRVSPIKARIRLAIRKAKATARDARSRQNLVAVLSKAASMARRKRASGNGIYRKINSAAYSTLSRQKTIGARLKKTGCKVPRCVEIEVRVQVHLRLS